MFIDIFVPLEYHRYRSGRVPLQSLDDLGSFVSVDAVDGTPLDHFRGPAQTIVQSEAVLILRREAGQLLLHALQNPDGGQVGLQNHVQLRGQDRKHSVTSLALFLLSLIDPSTTSFLLLSHVP